MTLAAITGAEPLPPRLFLCLKFEDTGDLSPLLLGCGLNVDKFYVCSQRYIQGAQIVKQHDLYS